MADTPPEYTVVARRYRPQQFAELIGQEHAADALVNALKTGRVAHAYLFTGARGVGKTSAARILAKALNCVTGPTPTPCDRCDSCLGIAAGQDVDVVEIDGASNNGVDAIRELRQNVGFLPTRSRYKVYIIDEVHMLSTGAFNALLKTLEEPPPHVKFIFATTEVQKLPITILSRCQRFDFAHVGPAKIFDQLKRVVALEGHEADDEALRLVARRAAGSMRDSQSLLDQLLASGPGRLTADHVHAVLGTAGDDRVLELAAAVFARDPKAALGLIGGWVGRGVQPGELVDQVIDHWRALMLAGCGSDLADLPLAPASREAVLRAAGSVSLDATLAGLDIWTETKRRMKGSGHVQLLLELAVVRLCRLDELLSVAELLRSPGAVPAGRPADADPSKKNVIHSNGAARPAERPGEPRIMAGEEPQAELALSEQTLPEVWARTVRVLADKYLILVNHLKTALSPAIFGPNSLAIRFPSRYNHAYEACNTELNLGRLQDALRKTTGRPAIVRFELVAGAVAPNGSAPTAPTAVNPAANRRKQLLDLPLFKKAQDTLGAQVFNVDDGFTPVPTIPGTRPPAAELPDDEPESVPDPEEP